MQYTDTVPTAWDETQASLKAHFLQESAWGHFQAALGKRVLYASGYDWSWLALVEEGKFGKRLYCPYGPTCLSPAAFSEAFEALLSCAIAERAMMIRVEPQGPLTANQLQRSGLQPAAASIQPRYTWVKDVRKNEEEILSEMSATNRNLYHTAAKKGIAFTATHDPAALPILLEMLHEVAQRNHIRIHSDRYFDVMAHTLFPLQAATLYIATHQGQPVAASLCFDNGRTRYYAHAGSHYEARKLHANSPLITHMLLDSKQSRQHFFDFYGIAPPDEPEHHWIGLTKFKQSFGGNQVDLHGTWEMGVRDLPYHLYRSLHPSSVIAKSAMRYTRGRYLKLRSITSSTRGQDVHTSPMMPAS